MAGGFKRSSRFGIIGIFVVAGACVAIGLTLGSGQANPKLALGLIFGVIAVFFALLLVLQRGDLGQTAGTDARATTRAAAEAGGRSIGNPTTMAEPELWAALAVEPIGPEAIRAREAMWGAARRSQRLGMVVVALIFLTVPAIYLTESLTPLMIGGPLIAIAAIYGAFRALAPGGEIAGAYDNTDLAMKPLGLGVVARPRVRFESRGPEMAGFNARLRGPLVLDGQRHGRQVSVSVGNSEAPGTSEVVAPLRSAATVAESSSAAVGARRAIGCATSGSPSGSPKPARRWTVHPPLEAWSPGVSVAFGSGRARLRHPRHSLKAASFRT